MRVRVEDSSASRMPAPPAPTMTTSYVCVCISGFPLPALLGALLGANREGGLGVDARVEGEDHERAEDHDEERAGDEQPLEDPARAVLLRVVVDDRPDPVEAVQLGEP